MDELKDKLVGIQIENFESKWYIPGQELERLFCPNVIEEAVARCGIEPYKREEVVKTILQGARKVFATLVLMGKEPSILRFIEHDHLQGQPLDAKLPLSRSELSLILDGSQSEAFYRTQWIVAAPLFHDDLSHRILNNATILPFTRNVRIASGAFGTVFDVTFEPKHQGAGSSSQLSMVYQTFYLSNSNLLIGAQDM